jgi:hypothetical protein
MRRGWDVGCVSVIERESENEREREREKKNERKSENERTRTRERLTYKTRREGAWPRTTT